MARKPDCSDKAAKVLEVEAGAVLLQTRFSLVRISVRDLDFDRNPSKGNLGLRLEWFEQAASIANSTEARTSETALRAFLGCVWICFQVCRCCPGIIVSVLSEV